MAGGLSIAGVGLFGAQLIRAATTFDYYIGPNGADSNPGTASAPWSINALNSKASVYAGKRVGLLDGTYNINSMMSSANWDRPALNIQGGTSTSPTVIAAVNLHKAVIDGADPSTGALPSIEAPLIGQSEKSGNLVIDGLTLRNSYSSVVCFYKSGGSTGVRVTGTVLQNCDISGARNLTTGRGNNCGAVRMWAQDGAIIRNNRIHDCFGGSATEHEGYGVITFYSSNNVYEYNTIYNCAVGIYNKQSGNSGHTIRYNYIECTDRSSASGLFDCNGGTSGTTYTINNNVIVSSEAMDMSGMAPPGQGGFKIFNNTFVWNTSPTGGIYLPTSGPIEFYNNIVAIAGKTGYIGAMTLCGSSLKKMDYNCYASSVQLGLNQVASLGSISLMTLSLWQATTGKDISTVAATPKFVGASWLNPKGYQLDGTSPGKDAGRIGGTSSGERTDMGAWGSGAARVGALFGTAPDSPANVVVS